MRWLVLALALAATSAPVAADPPGTVNNPYALMRALAPTLHANGYVARIDYEATCGDGSPGEFSPLTLRPPVAAEHEHGLDAVRARFAGGQVALTLEGKVVVIRVGEPRTQLLSAKLRATQLAAMAQFNGYFAAQAIVASDDLKAASRLFRMHLDDNPRFIDTLVQEPSSTAPHLSPILRDLTVAQALDEVATTFDGVVMFETCKRPDGEFVYYADYECVCE